jgi:hypothetical protein
MASLTMNFLCYTRKDEVNACTNSKKTLQAECTERVIVPGQEEPGTLGSEMEA